MPFNSSINQKIRVGAHAYCCSVFIAARPTRTMRHEVRGRRPTDDVSIPSGTLYINRINTSKWQLQGQILTSDAVVALLYASVYYCTRQVFVFIVVGVTNYQS